MSRDKQRDGFGELADSVGFGPEVPTYQLSIHYLCHQMQ